MAQIVIPPEPWEDFQPEFTLEFYDVQGDPDIFTYCKWLRQMIILHHYLMTELGERCIAQVEFDTICIELIRVHGEIGSQQCGFLDYQFADWNGTPRYSLLNYVDLELVDNFLILYNLNN